MNPPNPETSNSKRRATGRGLLGGRSSVAAGASLVLALGAIGSLGPPVGDAAMGSFEHFARSRPTLGEASEARDGSAGSTPARSTGSVAARDVHAAASGDGAADAGRRVDREKRPAIVYRAEDAIPEIGDVSDLPAFFRASARKSGSVDQIGFLADRAFGAPQNGDPGAGALGMPTSGQGVGLVAQLDATLPPTLPSKMPTPLPAAHSDSGSVPASYDER